MSDLDVAWQMADAADAETMARWRSSGVASTNKADGTPVTEADIASDRAMRAVTVEAFPDDAFLGEEIGAFDGSSGRRWIVDGIDGTRFFADGASTWGTLVALESDGEIVLGLATSPAQNRRWWAMKGAGAFTGSGESRVGARQIHVSSEHEPVPERTATLPSFDRFDERSQAAVRDILGGEPADIAWSHQLRVAEGDIDLCVWLGGDIWDHAAPSLIVEEAGGRFSDLAGGKRLDTRTAIYSNGGQHDELLAALHRTS